jgi:hypothetical protein
VATLCLTSSGSSILLKHFYNSRLSRHSEAEDFSQEDPQGLRHFYELQRMNLWYLSTFLSGSLGLVPVPASLEYVRAESQRCKLRIWYRWVISGCPMLFLDGPLSLPMTHNSFCEGPSLHFQDIEY